jgi:hypothetical protein
LIEERLLLSMGVELPHASWITVYEHGETRTELLLTNLQKPAPIFSVAKYGRPAIANCGTLRKILERYNAIPDLSRSVLHGEGLDGFDAHAVENDVPLFRNLEQEDAPLLD